MGRSHHHKNRYIPHSFQLLYGQKAIIFEEIESTSLRLALQEEELNSIDINQRIHALLALEEQRSFSLGNLKKR
jgi:hypothetical protein